MIQILKECAGADCPGTFFIKFIGAEAPHPVKKLPQVFDLRQRRYIVCQPNTTGVKGTTNAKMTTRDRTRNTRFTFMVLPIVT